jgi:hypothetical protein
VIAFESDTLDDLQHSLTAFAVQLRLRRNRAVVLVASVAVNINPIFQCKWLDLLARRPELARASG